MFCSNCGKEIANGTVFCPSCGEKIGENSSTAQKAVKSDEVEKVLVRAENKNYDSIEAILKEKIPLVNPNKKEAVVLDDLSDRKRKIAANQIARKKINSSDILALLDESFFDLGTRGNIFTKNAVYEKYNLFMPLVVKYTDIEEVWIEKENDESVCIVKANTGLVWKIQQSSFNIEEFAKMIAQLADFVKNHPSEVSTNIKTSTEDENTWNQKGNIIVTAIASAVFAWNSYAIVHNFSVHDGYFFAIIGIIVNLFIMFAYSQNVTGIFKKKVSDGWWGWFGWGYFIVLFLIFGISIGHIPYKDLLAQSAKPLVSQILEDNYGSYMDVAECEYVDSVFKISDHIYKASAHLDNGTVLQITISDADKGNIYVEINNY